MLLSRGDVATFLGIPLRSLTWWIWALDESRRYRYFEIERRDGRVRPIHAPIKPIKDLQRTLADRLADWYRPPVHAHGFVRGRSARSNASPHRRQQWVLRIDLLDFFPSIHYGRVRGMFGAYPFDFPADVATLLAQLCCHRNQLPQGAPTSPIVSNFVCRGLDTRLARLARAERCYYTRYADDLTFSTDRTAFPATLASRDAWQSTAGPAVREIIESEGFRINDDKTRLTRKTQRQRVTGLIVNDRLSVPREYVRSLRNLLYIWRTHGEDAAVQAFARANHRPNWPPEKPAPDFRSVIRGRVEYVGSVKGRTHPVYVALSDALALVDGPSRSRRAPPRVDPQTVEVYTEGETDIQHLRAALKHFHSLGEFSTLALDFRADASRGGDRNLAQHLRSLPATKPSVPTICLFDRDNEKLLKDLRLNQADWQDYGNGVVAAAVVVPSFRSEPLCIEMLYRDVDLARHDANGRRVFLLSEFDPVTGHHISGRCSIPNPRNQTLVCDPVHEFGTGRSIALGKTAFAKAVEEGSPPFDTISFEGFRPTFQMLVEAVGEVASKVSKPKASG